MIETPTATATDLEALTRRYAAAWEAHDLDAVMAQHADDTVFQLHDGSPPVEGADQVRLAFELILAAYPDLTATPVRLGLGPSHVVHESRMHATLDGARQSIDAVDVLWIADGRIARKDTYLDTAAIAGAG